MPIKLRAQLPSLIMYSGFALVLLGLILGLLSTDNPLQVIASIIGGISLGGAVVGIGAILENSDRRTAAAEKEAANVRAMTKASVELTAFLREALTPDSHT